MMDASATLRMAGDDALAARASQLEEESSSGAAAAQGSSVMGTASNGSVSSSTDSRWSSQWLHNDTGPRDLPVTLLMVILMVNY